MGHSSHPCAHLSCFRARSKWFSLFCKAHQSVFFCLVFTRPFKRSHFGLLPSLAAFLVYSSLSHMLSIFFWPSLMFKPQPCSYPRRISATVCFAVRATWSYSVPQARSKYVAFFLHILLFLSCLVDNTNRHAKGPLHLAPSHPLAASTCTSQPPRFHPVWPIVW